LLLLLFKEPKVLLVQHSITTLAIGLAMFASLRWEENMIWHYYREFHGDTDESRLLLAAYWRRQSPQVQLVTRCICRVWGSALCIDAILRVLFVFQYSVPTIVVLSPILTIVMAVFMALWTYMYVRQSNLPPWSSPAMKSYIHVAPKESVPLYQTI
jgi:hypothetical protein